MQIAAVNIMLTSLTIPEWYFDYKFININLSSPTFYSQYLLHEAERQILTKYRCGCHQLKVITGSYYRISFEERKSTCNGIQTLHHVIFECPLTQIIRHGNCPQTLDIFFKINLFAATKLHMIEEILKLR